ncbi:MAG: sortase [Candidatus Doudnabacteria bacterium]|nr:sortase [Candidatus Doudnabacteria bacterium]
MHYLKTVAKIVGIAILLMLVLNWQYFYIQIKYYTNPPHPLPPPPVSESPKGEPNRLTIRSLAIEAPVVYVEQEDERMFQKALRDGVVHYPQTAFPGQPGNVYIFGHSSDFPTTPGNYKNVFALLPKIEAGDEIEVTDQEGNIYVYIVTETKVVSPSDTHVLEQDDSIKQLTLQTSYPVGTALRRFLAVASLKE